MGRKKRNNIGRILLPSAVAALLALVAWVFSPGERFVEDNGLQELQIDPDSLAEERHFGPFLKDSILTLVSQIDSSGQMVKVEEKGDSVRFERPNSFPASRFVRIFQNQRSSKDFRRLKNSPLSMLPGTDKGFTAPMEEIDGRKYLVLPYDVVAGWITELGNRSGK